MRARRFAFSSTALSGLALLWALATPASAVPLQDAWKACNASQTAPGERIAQCDLVLASDELKSENRAQALTARGFARSLQQDYTAAIADFDAAVREYP